jgi:hypothetical protein
MQVKRYLVGTWYFMPVNLHDSGHCAKTKLSALAYMHHIWQKLTKKVQYSMEYPENDTETKFIYFSSMLYWSAKDTAVDGVSIQARRIWLLCLTTFTDNSFLENDPFSTLIRLSNRKNGSGDLPELEDFDHYWIGDPEHYYSAEEPKQCREPEPKEVRIAIDCSDENWIEKIKDLLNGDVQSDKEPKMQQCVDMTAPGASILAPSISRRQKYKMTKAAAKLFNPIF